MKGFLTAVLITSFLLIPMVSANYCSGNVLVKQKNVSVNGNLIPIQNNETCQWGCDALRAKCFIPEDIMPMPFLILFEILGFVFLGFTVFRKEIIFPIVGMILFFMMSVAVLASQGFVAGAGLMALNLGFALLLLVLFIMRVMMSLKEDILERDRELMGD